MSSLHVSESILVYALAIFTCEFLELYWQKGKSILNIVLYNYSMLKLRGVFVYMLMHVSFIFILYLAISIDNDTMWAIFFVKMLDIGYKFYLLGRITNNTIKLNIFTINMLSANIGYFKYSTCMLYSLGFMFFL